MRDQRGEQNGKHRASKNSRLSIDSKRSFHRMTVSLCVFRFSLRPCAKLFLRGVFLAKTQRQLLKTRSISGAQPRLIDTLLLLAHLRQRNNSIGPIDAVAEPNIQHAHVIEAKNSQPNRVSSMLGGD